ncbi:TniQ family protein [Kitasatospora sp. NPDC017646]|uniref:TniQ family protein n=1 Tax=Kitasatospora sp. NPDC017646 TaxID=3364024 RepID=UPI0037A49E9A
MLPRSLDPLPGESLSGFILRLAYHLDLSPRVLMQRTGLAVPGEMNPSSQARHLLMLEPTILESFARCTRLTDSEAEALTLRRFVGRYPDVTEAVVRPGGALHPSGKARKWLFLTSTRYCPHCLAGDGSDIQRRYGGAWKLEWHLGMVFACLEHNTLLEELCPSCQQPAHSRGDWNATRTLLPAQWLPNLHPAQCRTGNRNPKEYVPCGQRLDLPGRRKKRPLEPQFAAVQRNILDFLAPGHDPMTASAALFDLKVMAAVVCATWPQAATLAAFKLPRYLNAYLAQPNSTSKSPTRWETVPLNSAFTAAVLSLADTILSQPRSVLQQTLSVLLEGTESAKIAKLNRTRGTLASGCSPQTRLAIEHAMALRSPRPSMKPGPDAEPIIPVLQRPFLGEHIPQRIPTDWYRVLTSSGVRVHARGDDRFRRTASIHLVQATTGMSFFAAAQFLGIPTSWLSGQGKKVSDLTANEKRFATNQGLAAAFERLAERIAKLPLIDYSHRRQQLSFWHLSHDEWHAIADRLPLLVSGERKIHEASHTRECASAYIWSKATGSEWALAPCFHPPFTTRARHIFPNVVEFRFLDRIHYAEQAPEFFQALRRALDAYVSQLTLRISASA